MNTKTKYDGVLQSAAEEILQTMADHLRGLGTAEAEIEQICRQKTVAVTRRVIEEPDVWIALEWLQQNGRKAMRR